MNEKMPSVTLKRKNISALIEYCLENKIEMNIKAHSIHDEFDVEFAALDTKKAISLGMCLRDLRLELNGQNPLLPSKVAKKSTAKETLVSKKDESKSAITFGEESLEFNLEDAN